MRRHVFATPVLLTALVAAGITACSSASSDAGLSANSSASQSQGDTVDGGALRIGLDREVASLDPAAGAIISQTTMSVAYTMYDALFTYGDNGAIVPQLAKSAESSDDLKTWTIKLHPDVTFSNGDPLDAQAVVDHITRLQDPAAKCACAFDAAQITSMTAIDATTVEFTLAAADAGFLSTLTRNLGFIASATEKDSQGNPLGSGPYVPKELIQGSSVSFAKRADYWGTPGHADTVKFTFLPDADSRYQSLVTGAVDMVWTENPAQYTQAPNDGLVTAAAPAATSTGVFNTTTGVFSDVRVRQAVQYAIDRSVLFSVVNAGQGAISEGPIGSHSIYGVQADYPAYDPTKAKALVAEIGTPISFTYTLDNRPQSQQRATAIQQMLKDVGITMEIKPVDISSWSQALMSKNFEMIDMTTSLYGDTDAAMLGFTATAPLNFSGISIPEIDSLVIEARATKDTAARGELFKDAATLVSENAAVAFYTENPAGFIMSSKVGGVPDLSSRNVVTVRPSEFWIAQ